jgi:hypothetical protein
VTGTTSRTASPERGRTLLPERLVSGYEAFLGGRFTREQDRFRHLAEAGQKPRIMLIGYRRRSSSMLNREIALLRAT